MTPSEALKVLEERASHLVDVDYKEIVFLFKNVIQHIPIPVAKLHRGVAIDRVRPNDGEKLFVKARQLNYITDKAVIADKLTEFGRGNCPHQPAAVPALS